MFTEFWPYFLIVVDLLVVCVASAHAVLNKRDVRAAIGWVGLIILAPLVGSAFYAIFGVNRIKRRASSLRAGMPTPARRRLETSAADLTNDEQSADALSHDTAQNLRVLARYVGRVTGSTLVAGNRFEALLDGDQAYPGMLDAIRNAKASVGLATYIFDNDHAGRLFVEALTEAVHRGVLVRVLIDGVGAKYSDPPICAALRKRGVPTAEFLRSVIPWRNPYLNLRNHRKILVVDGKVGFCGGLNIRAGCLLEFDVAHPVQDLHFRCEGPVVASMRDCFATDWAFTTGEQLRGREWHPTLQPEGSMTARGIPDGPDEDFESLRWTILGALAAAQDSIKIVTPYFVPDQTLITALSLAAMRGVVVDVAFPAVNNLQVVQWATAGLVSQILERGCRVWLTAPPFDHSKLMVVDGGWAQFGSANWDARSLRLNFEYNLECYDRAFTASLDQLIDCKLKFARRLTLEEINSRSLPIKLRDGMARLFSPYL